LEALFVRIPDVSRQLPLSARLLPDDHVLPRDLLRFVALGHRRKVPISRTVSPAMNRMLVGRQQTSRLSLTLVEALKRRRPKIAVWLAKVKRVQLTLSR
jgi:hypothetical protein